MDRREPDATLTTDEVNAQITAANPGSFFALPNLNSIGVMDLTRAVQNYTEAAIRAKSAYAQGFFFEVINLRVQHIEMWLRILVVHEHGSGYVITPNDKRTFGQIIEECVSVLPSALVDRLRAFNRSRIAAVHKYLLGGTDYVALKIACDDSAGIDGEVYSFVVGRVGRPIASVQGNIGEFVVYIVP